MQRHLAFLAVIAALLGSAAPAFAQPTGDVVVHVENVRSSEGHVRVELCTSDQFLTDACVVAGSAPAQRGETVVTLQDVPPGVYAVQVFHDANDDHKVNRGLFGIPTEDVGFSREAPLGLHGPQFIKAAFNHAADEQVVTLHLHHF
ncbi:MAG TPA: DUF2141 domain-containing protein [Phenylobacterium sp.]|jgi:uncharacterized protein (DUF2141 family)|nr:DUF2141 domain-containing protein [Phenylobacterium sp.]